MKEDIVIPHFNGISGTPDPKDLAEGLSPYALDLEPGAPTGRFRGARENDTAFSGPLVRGATLDDGKRLIFYDGSDIVEVPDTDTPVPATVATAAGTDIESDGAAVRVPLGGSGGASDFVRWLGDIDDGQFGGAAPSGTQVEEAGLRNGAITTNATAVTWGASSTADEIAFENSTSYVWAASLVYDGIQEGPLKKFKDALTGSAEDAKTATVRLEVNDPTVSYSTTALNPRVTGVVLYRAIGPSGAAIPDSDWTYVDFIDINDGGWTDNSGSHYIDIVDDGSIGATYEARTGMNPTLTNWDVRYRLCQIMNGYNFVADINVVDGVATNVDLDEPSMMIRSKRHRYDTFDWTADILTLPSTPNALRDFNGKLYAFAENEVYVIDPEAFRVESVLSGEGALSQGSVRVTGRGMLYCNKQNIYFHDGNGSYAIGDVVLDNAIGGGWRDALHTDNPVVLFDSEYEVFAILYNYSASANYMLTYHPGLRRWHLLSAPAGTIDGGVQLPDGTGLFSVADQVYSLFGGSSRRSWTYYTPDFQHGSSPAYYYHLRTLGAEPTVVFHENDPSLASPTTATTTSLGGSTYESKVNGNGTSRLWNKVRYFQVKVSASDEIQEMSLTRRGQVVK